MVVDCAIKEMTAMIVHMTTSGEVSVTIEMKVVLDVVTATDLLGHHRHALSATGIAVFAQEIEPQTGSSDMIDVGRGLLIVEIDGIEPLAREHARDMTASLNMPPHTVPPETSQICRFWLPTMSICKFQFTPYKSMQLIMTIGVLHTMLKIHSRLVGSGLTSWCFLVFPWMWQSRDRWTRAYSRSYDSREVSNTLGKSRF
jgi:hypothetical protein